MKILQKKMTAVGISVFLVMGVVFTGCAKGDGESTVQGTETVADVAEARESTVLDKAGEAAYQRAKPDLVFWYMDDSYTEFMEYASRAYFKKTKTKISVNYRESLDYIGEIYEKTMKNEGFPELYLLSGSDLEEAYLYGLTAPNKDVEEYKQAAGNALLASTYNGKILGYPISYNTSLFVYQTGYFEVAPGSLQAIIDYSNQNEPGENVEYLLEWNIKDAFYDFPFVSNSVTFDKNESETLKIKYNEELYNQDLAFFEEILESFSVDAENVSEDRIIENFLAGRTLCAIIDTDSLYRLEGYSYSLMEIPDLNEALKSSTCALTDMLIVNDFAGEKAKKIAADFAKFATIELSDTLHAKTGHYSVILSEDPDWVEQVAYDSYESAVILPSSRDGKDFWVKLEETISKYF